MKKWVCQKNKKHIFDDYDPDPNHPYYCTIDPPFEGILREEEVGKEPIQEFKAYPKPGPLIPITVKENPHDEVGLCIMLMDASDSMTDAPFEGIPLSRMTLVANSAASGIFDMERMQSNPNAYVACFKFDNRVEQMFVDTVANLIKKYRDIDHFAKYIYDELWNFRGGTDINKALEEAHLFVTRFLNKQLKDFRVEDYTPMMQQVLKYNLESISVPNVRVLLYTDGKQYVKNGSKVLNPNPFKVNMPEGLGCDILIGAFFGSKTDEGYKDLLNLVSDCPSHRIPQLFLFDDAANIGNLKYLFRMASGASGFCPHDLESLLKR